MVNIIMEVGKYAKVKILSLHLYAHCLARVLEYKWLNFFKLLFNIKLNELFQRKAAHLFDREIDFYFASYSYRDKQIKSAFSDL